MEEQGKFWGKCVMMRILVRDKQEGTLYKG